MLERLQNHVETSFTREKWTAGFRSIFQPVMLEMGMPQDAIDLILNDAFQDQDFDGMRAVAVELYQELYTPEELVILLDFYEQNPWYLEKSSIYSDKLNVRVQPIINGVRQRAEVLLEKYAEDHPELF